MDLVVFLLHQNLLNLAIVLDISRRVNYGDYLCVSLMMQKLSSDRSCWRPSIRFFMARPCWDVNYCSGGQKVSVSDSMLHIS